jgi:uncharacterized protein (TIGR03437 family)
VGYLDFDEGRSVLVSNPVSVQLFQDGVGSNTLTTTGTSSSPGIFPIIVNGKNYPAGVFPDGTLFATGLFRTQAGVVPPPQTFTDVTVTIGNITFAADAAVLIAPGEFQINFTVPQQFASLPEDDYPISIQYKGMIGTSSPVAINSDPPGPLVIPIQH